MEALAISLPWFLIYGYLPVVEGLSHVYPIVAVGPVSAVVGAHLVTHRRRMLGGAWVFLMVLAGTVAMPNWLVHVFAPEPVVAAPLDAAAFRFTVGDGTPMPRTAPADFRDAVTVVEFWTTNCGVCFERFPDLERFHQTYRDDPRVDVYAVNLTVPQDEPGDAERLIERFGYTFPNLYATDSFEEVSQRLGFRGVPAIAIYDADQSLAFVGTPEFDRRIFVRNVGREVERLLQGGA